MRDALVRDLVESGLARIVAGERADKVLERVLRSNRDLTSEERARVARWTLALSLWRGRIDVLAGGDRTLWLPLFLIDRERWSAADAALFCGVDEASLTRPVLDPVEPIESLALRRSLPTWLAARWIELFGMDGADALAAATNEPGPVCLRANLLKTTRDELRTRLAGEGVSTTPSLLVPHGLRLDGRANIFALEAWRDGWFEVQDEASQLVIDALDAKPGETVIDLCAGSGGKTLGLAAAMRNEGRLLAIDANPARLRDLEVRARRAGARLETRCDDGRTVELAPADAVLVDVPCSELGVLRRSPDARWRLTPDTAASFAPLQRALLDHAARLVRPGGRVVYATCSIDRAENEEVVHSATSLLELRSMRTLRPDREGCDGFFVAVFRRNDHS